MFDFLFFVAYTIASTVKSRVLAGGLNQTIKFKIVGLA